MEFNQPKHTTQNTNPINEFKFDNSFFYDFLAMILEEQKPHHITWNELTRPFINDTVNEMDSLFLKAEDFPLFDNYHCGPKVNHCIG